MYKCLIALLTVFSLQVSTSHAKEACAIYEEECLLPCLPICDPIDDYKGISGKIDLAPAYVHIDLLKSGVTQHKMDLSGIKGDLYYRIWSGLVIKPAFLYAREDRHQHVLTGGIGIGFTLPCKECLYITPVVGCNWGDLRSRIKVPFTLDPNTNALTPIPSKIKEKFRSASPYIGLEASWTFYPSWRIVGSYQYSWSRTHTTFKHLPHNHFKENSKGSSYSGIIEYDLNSQWSINLGGAYNTSLSKEKHGLRGYGFKLGLGYWY